MSARGGEPREIAKFQDAKFSQVLPEGRVALLERSQKTSISGDYWSVETLALDSLQRKPILERGHSPRYLRSGHLLFARADNLFIVPFDSERLQVSGEPAAVVAGVSMEDPAQDRLRPELVRGAEAPRTEAVILGALSLAQRGARRVQTDEAS